MKTEVDGLCHLLAHEINKRISGTVIGTTTPSGRTWHYAVLTENGSVIDKHGVHDSVDSFLAKAKDSFGREDFSITEESISKEMVDIFTEDEKLRASTYAENLLS
jgi:hypothetical protein